MEKIKQLNSLIDQICSEMHGQPPVKLYNEVYRLIESRVDLPKHSIAAISKKLTSKSNKILFITFDLLEYLAYNLELPFYSQIATKEFLLKISGLLMNKETAPLIIEKVLRFIKCCDELFRPLEDLLPLFFHFQAGLLRKQYQIPHSYVSLYRPKQLKQYKKVQKAQSFKKKPVVELTKNEQKQFQEVRQQIILTNEIISNCDPSQDIRKNDLLQQLMQQLKQSEKSINKTIDENPSQKILELALATNDDLVTTYRRYKDLQRNKKPETFIMTELASDLMKEESNRASKKNNQPKIPPQKKVQQKRDAGMYQSVFESFQQPSPQKKVESKPSVVIEKKSQPQNIFDLVDSSEKVTDVTQITNVLDILDISPPESQAQNKSMNLDFLSESGIKNNGASNISDIFSIDLGLNNNLPSNPQPTNEQSGFQQLNYQPVNYQSMNYQQPNYQSMNYQSMSYQQPNYQQNMMLGSQNFSQPTEQLIYQNISLATTEQEKPQVKNNTDKQKQITDLTQFKF